MAIHAGVGISREEDTFKAAQEALRLARSALREQRIDLAMVFGSVEFFNANTIKLIREELGAIPIIGCSSLALISTSGVLKYGLAILALNFSSDIYFNTGCVTEINAKSAILAGEELGEKLLYGFKNIRRDLSIIFSDGSIRDASGFLWGLQERVGKSFPLAGACASNNLTIKETYQCYENGVFTNGACGILWGGKLNFGLSIKHGWKPLGKPRYVTKASGNVVYEIDGAPAAAVYKEYFDCDLDKLRNDLKRISILYPIGIFVPGEEEYLLRNVLSVEDDGALIFQGNVAADSMIRLMIGTKESCLEACRQAAEEAKRGLLGRPGNFVLVFNSVSRYILLGRQANKELEIIKEIFGGEIPIIGIYTYGELAPLKAINYQGQAYFHNQSIEILAVGG